MVCVGARRILCAIHRWRAVHPRWRAIHPCWRAIRLPTRSRHTILLLLPDGLHLIPASRPATNRVRPAVDAVRAGARARGGLRVDLGELRFAELLLVEEKEDTLVRDTRYTIHAEGA